MRWEGKGNGKESGREGEGMKGKGERKGRGK